MVISGPSGSGKSTIIDEIIKRRPGTVHSVSVTTRRQRSYEVEGVDYRFLSHGEFQKWIGEGRFLEWAEVHGDYYGTEREAIERDLRAGKTVLLDIDVNGGENIKARYPGTTLIFLHPPSLEELRRRLRLRGADDEASIERRLDRYPFEKAKGDEYPHRIVNRDLERTVLQVLDIIDSQVKQTVAVDG